MKWIVGKIAEKKLGFVQTDDVLESDGIQYIPMKYEVK